MPSSVRPDAAVFIFFVALLVFISGGHFASFDAGEEFRQSEVLARTGSWATDRPSAGHWLAGPSGSSYEVHDPGNALLMLPSAALAAWKAPNVRTIVLGEAPSWARMIFSLQLSAICGMACFAFYKMLQWLGFSVWSFPFAALFPLTTLFGPYSRSAWDVTGATVFVTLLLVSASRIVLRKNAGPAFLWSCVFLALAGSFRYGLLPFLALSLGLLVLTCRRDIGAKWFAAGVGAGLIALSPVFYVNWLRVGNPLRPALAAPRFVEQGIADLHGNLGNGLYGLVFSPVRGLIFFCPLLLIAFAAFLVWRRMPAPDRRLISCFSLGAILYTLLFAKLRTWSNFGLGPRYLVPLVPIVFLDAILVFRAAGKRLRIAAVVLFLASFFCMLPALLVNWHRALVAYDRTLDGKAQVNFSQQRALWFTLSEGLQGRPLPLEPGQPAGSERSTVPDFWTVSLMKTSGAGKVAGAVCLLLLLTAIAWSGAAIWRSLNQQREADGTFRLAGPPS